MNQTEIDYVVNIKIQIYIYIVMIEVHNLFFFRVFCPCDLKIYSNYVGNEMYKPGFTYRVIEERVWKVPNDSKQHYVSLDSAQSHDTPISQ
jgi:hypothetical protein